MSDLVTGIYTNAGVSVEKPLAVDVDGKLLVSGSTGGGGGGVTTTPATPLPQTTLAIAAGATASYAIPAGCRSLTICITSGSLVYYTEDGSTPTVNSCWFGYGSKEIWDAHIPAGATLKMLATAAATIAIQVRV
jgi:Chitobiase/beta-hexosaminidase C-terminal domain